jgi:hypothetical protein
MQLQRSCVRDTKKQSYTRQSYVPSIRDLAENYDKTKGDVPTSLICCMTGAMAQDFQAIASWQQLNKQDPSWQCASGKFIKAPRRLGAVNAL